MLKYKQIVSHRVTVITFNTIFYNIFLMVEKVKRRKVEYVNIPIPRPLYERLAKALEGTGYRSVTEYIVFLIRKQLPDLESSNVKRRLKALGYLPEEE